MLKSGCFIAPTTAEIKSMEFPTFLLQSGNIMTREKIACSFSDYPVSYCSFSDLKSLTHGSITKHVPVGSVEFVREFCRVLSLGLPEEVWDYRDLTPYLHRSFRPGNLSEALLHEFVKPRGHVKMFTGCRKDDLQPELKDKNPPVWISDYVPLGSEFRFYIHDFVPGPKIVGWARYDDSQCSDPYPDIGLVEEIAQLLHDDLGPNAYSIDIGWRPDIERYSLIELNDGWSLGLYENRDPQSVPPSRKDYAEMLVSRWRQIVFCNIV